MTHIRFAFLLAIPLLCIDCAGSGSTGSPVAPAPTGQTPVAAQTCRTFATNLLLTHEICIGNPAVRCGTTGETLTCEFQSGSGQLVCRRQRSDTGAVLEVTTDEYGTPSDFISATGVIPPVMRAVKHTAVVSGIQSVTERVISDGRLLSEADSIVSPTGGASTFGPTIYTYDSWDAAGRPLRGFTSDKGTMRTFTYDEQARTQVRVDKTGGSSTRLTERFDANGERVWQSVETSGDSQTFQSQVVATQRVCQ